eukprot:2706083-Pleurochrysis_carterae.AAC.1
MITRKRGNLENSNRRFSMQRKNTQAQIKRTLGKEGLCWWASYIHARFSFSLSNSEVAVDNCLEYDPNKGIVIKGQDDDVHEDDDVYEGAG